MKIKYLLIAISAMSMLVVDKPDGTAASGLSATMEVTVTQ